MQKFKGILICSDLDGTLLSSDRTISDENLKAIEYFKSEGGSFTIISGRVPTTAAAICEIVKPNAPIGCFNGGGIYDHRKQKYAWIETLPGEALELVKYVEENMPEVGIQINTAKTIYICKDNPAMFLFRDYPTVTCRYNDINDPIVKVVFADFDAEKISRLADMLSSHPLAKNFDFIHSEAALYEILPKNVSKGNALLKLAQIYGFEKTIAIGDYDNDVSMIQNATVGIAVSNACDAAKAAADIVTVSNDEHAIARIIDDLDSGMIKF